VANKSFTGPPKVPKYHPLSRKIEVYRQARDVEQDPALRQAMSMQMVDLIRQFVLFDLRAGFFVDHRKVDKFRGGKTRSRLSRRVEVLC